MHRKSPIKVSLLIGTALGGGAPQYRIKQIANAVTLGAFNGRVLRTGDVIDEKEAEYLTRSYLVTVTTK